MRLTRFAVLSVLVVALALQASAALAYPIGGWARISEGVDYNTGYATSPRPMRAFALRIDLQNPYVSMYASHDNGGSPYEVALQTTPAFLSEHGLVAAVNTCYFNAGLSPNTNIEGLLISNGAVVSTWQAARDAELHIYANRTAAVLNNGGVDGAYTACAGDAYYLINGGWTGDNTVTQPRTGGGVSQDGRYVYLVCVDGRQPGWSEGATIWDMCDWMSSFGAYNAMNFDGGGSTTMALAYWGVVNSPCYGYARSVGASLGVSSVPYVNPPYLFGEHNQAWSPGNSISPIYWTSGFYGSMFFDQTGYDCFTYSPRTSFTGQWAPEVMSVSVYPQNGSTANHDMQVFWKTDAEDTWTADKSAPVVNYTAMNTWTRVNLDMNSSKWWGQTINQFRLDVDQTNHGTRFIVNDVVKQSRLWWHFSTDTMGWYAVNSLTAPWWTDQWGWPGVLVTDQTGNDAHMRVGIPISDNFPFYYLGGVNDRIHVRVYPQNGSTTSHDMAVYWAHEGENYETEAKSTHVNFTGKDQWVDVYLPVGTNANWANQHITSVRLDFDQVNHGNRWIVDDIVTEY